MLVGAFYQYQMGKNALKDGDDFYNDYGWSNFIIKNSKTVRKFSYCLL